MTGSNSEQPKKRRLSRFGHDISGTAYTASSDPESSLPRLSTAPVASRTTDLEARDLLALRRAKRGDDKAFAELIRDNDEDVCAFVSALFGSSELDSVCIQIYLRAYRGVPVAPSTSPRLWLLGIADGTVRDLFRRRGHLRDSPIADSIDWVQRLALAAIEGVGLTPREAARLCNVSPEEVQELVQTSHLTANVSLPLPAPGVHDPSFWEELGKKLLIERARPAVAAPTADPTEVILESRTIGVPPSARTRGAARGMAKRVSEQNPSVFPWRIVMTVLGIVSFAVVVVGLTFGLAHKASHHDASLGDTASKVLDKLDAALANDVAIRATAIVTSNVPQQFPSGQFRLIRINTGSWRVQAIDGSLDQGYDIAQGIYGSITQSKSGTVLSTEIRSGLAPGPPASVIGSNATIGDLIGEGIRVVRDGIDGTVTTRTPVTVGHSTTELGTPRWVISSDRRKAITPNKPLLAGVGALARLGADRVTLVADQSLTLPVQVTLYRKGHVLVDIRFVGIAIAQQAPKTSLIPPPRQGTPPNRTSDGFTQTELGKLGQSGLGAIPTPSYLPAGYIMSAVAENRATRTTVLCYRNGSRQIVLTFKPASHDPSGDPLAGGGQSSRAVDIHSGTFARHKGWASSTPLDHVWVNGSEMEVIALGDPDTDLLTKVIASLS